MANRIDTAMPVDTPAHEHHPTGRCKECILWSTTDNPNLGLCLVTPEDTNSDWSCPLFTPTQPFL